MSPEKLAKDWGFLAGFIAGRLSDDEWKSFIAQSKSVVEPETIEILISLRSQPKAYLA